MNHSILGVLGAVLLAASVRHSFGQVATPVYFDDAPRTAAVIAGLGDFGPNRDAEEAARTIQARLDEEARRVLPVPGDPDLYVPVRDHLNRTLLASAPLLERYRASIGPAAEALLAQGRIEEVEGSYLLTTAGYEAVLRVAQQRLERAQFAASARTMAQLDRHPDRRGERARAALQILDLTLSYLEADVPGGGNGPLAQRSRELSDRWRAELEIPRGGAVGAQGPALAPGRTPMDRQGAVSLQGLLPRPLWSDFTGDGALSTARVAPERSSRQVPPEAAYLFSLPAVSGDVVYVNDSQMISAWNRFTLSLLWRVRVDAGKAAPLLQARDLVAEPCGIAADGERVYALSGLLFPADTASMPRAVLAMDASNGAVLWAKTIDQLGEPALQEASFSGPPLVDQGVVVLTATKHIARRRLNSSYLIGLNGQTGELLWSTVLGSVGALPYGSRELSGDSVLVHDGVAYRCDRVGFAAAVDVVTGGLLWIRRITSEYFGQGPSLKPWESSRPVWHEGRLFVMSPDRRELLMLDAATGDLKAREPAGRYDQPRYLLAAGDRLIAVSHAGLFATRASAFGTSQDVEMIAITDTPGIRGRVVAAGNDLIIPTIDGLQIVAADAAPGTEPKLIELDHSGMVIPLPGQILAVDDARIHSYLLWETADQLLTSRMREDPADPLPAVTYAELSYRADKASGLLPAVDHAIKAIESNPLLPRMDQGRSRLFRSLLEMVEPPPGSPPGARLGPQVKEALIERLGRSAALPMERVAHQMASGHFYESEGQPGKAVEAYQNVLQTAVLAETTYTAGDTTVPAEDEATRRLRRVVRQHGREVYAGYDAEADQEFAAASASLGPEPFERVARRYPVSRVAARAWNEAATRYQSQGKAQLSIWALEEGLRLAEDSLDPDDPIIGEIGGRLVMELVRNGRPFPAAAALERLLREHPRVSLVDQGRTLESVSLLEEIRGSLARGERRPAVGARPANGQELIGVQLLVSMDESAGDPPLDRVLMVANDQAVSMWKSEGGGPIAKIWDGIRGETLLRQQADGAYFSRRVDEKTTRDHVFIKRHPDTGTPIWETPPLRSVMRGGHRPAEQARVPLIPQADGDDLIYIFENDTLVVATVGGAFAAFDLETGRTLWRNERLMHRVHDLAILGGTLVIGGADETGGRKPAPGLVDLEPDAGPPVILAVDARSGQLIQRTSAESELRWLMTTPEGELIVGTQAGVMKLDIFRGRVAWRAESKELADTTAAFAAPGRIIVKSDDDVLWQIETATGVLRREPLETRDRLGSGYGVLTWRDLGERLAVATRHGVLLYDRSGALVGTNAGEGDDRLLPAVFSKNHIITLGTTGAAVSDTSQSFTLSFYSVEGCRLDAAIPVEIVGDVPPTRIALLDGKIVISAGPTTRVLEAPGP